MNQLASRLGHRPRSFTHSLIYSRAHFRHSVNMKKQQTKVPVTERALIQRINRKLAQEKWPKGFRATRSTGEKNNLGDFYVLDLERNMVVDHHCTPDKYGRELGVLKPYEELAER